jgi:YHS domain-containing protein
VSTIVSGTPVSRSKEENCEEVSGPRAGADTVLGNVSGAVAAKGDKEEMVTCPVLKQKVAKSKAIKVVHNGKTYYVCCDSCADQIKSGKVK